MESQILKPNRDGSIQTYGAIIFAVLIAVIGGFMMTLTSSPQMKGAAMLWVPAALQLIAGIWFGPTKGLLAGGLGAYAAGIIAYGGWGLVDIIMNPIAGGIANAWLPAILFRTMRINPNFGFDSKNATARQFKNIFIGLLFILILVIIIGISPLFVSYTQTWIPYAIALGVLIIIPPILLKVTKVKMNIGSLFLATIIVILISAISALIGCLGVIVSGNTWEAAFFLTGIGWFLGDTVSCFLGLFFMAIFTDRARKMGLSSI